MGRFDDLSARDRVMVALDCGPEEARALADKLEGHATWLKVGITLIYDGGLPLVKELRDRGFKIFVDSKFHDIPHQVRGAVMSAAHSGADLVTVHGSGSEKMLVACHEAADQSLVEFGHKPYVIAITVLTSMDAEELAKVGVTRPIPEQAAALAKLAVGDQSRVATPAAAVNAGASHIVIGRPITQAGDPVAAFESIVAEIEAR